VLSVAKLQRGREGYYLATVLSGGQDPRGLVEAEGHWLGRGAETLALSGTVAPKSLRAILAGVDPTSGEILSRSHETVRVVAYDCTYSAPKSVSVLHALGTQQVQAEVRSGHEQATQAALGYLERHGARVRRSQARGEPLASVPAQGFVAAAFLHRTSRAPDPHLHTHVLVANLSAGADGRWSALDARGLYLELGTARDLYETQLRAELTARLGVSWRELRGAWADIAGIDLKLTRAFSRRSVEIEAVLEQSGRSSRHARLIASVATRPEKDLGTSYESLVADWRELSYRLGVSDARLASVLGRAQPAAEPADRWAERALGRSGILERDGVCNRGALVRSRCASLPFGADVAEIERDVDALVAQGRLVRVAQPQSPLVRGLKASSGRRIPTGVVETTYTTPEILALHDRLGDLVRDHPGAVELVAYDPGERLDALDKLGDLISERGRRVTAVAPGRVAAASFEAVTGIETVPVAQLELSPAMRHEGVVDGLVVLAEAQRLGPWELASALESTLGRGDSVVVFVPAASLKNRFGTASTLAAHLGYVVPNGLSKDEPRASRERIFSARGRGPESHSFDGREVTLVTDGRTARDELIRAWQSERDSGRRSFVVASEDAVVARLREVLEDAGGSPEEVIEARRLNGVLANERRSPRAESRFVVLGALPVGVAESLGDGLSHVAVVPAQLSPADRIGRAAEVARPRYLISKLGPIPGSLSERAHWRHGATAIETFRQHWSITDHEHAFGDSATLRSLELKAPVEMAETRLELHRALRSGDRFLAGMRHGLEAPGRWR
jgi:conjugative relaxase-like TrwC/TraI family protein